MNRFRFKTLFITFLFVFSMFSSIFAIPNKVIAQESIMDSHSNPPATFSDDPIEDGGLDEVILRPDIGNLATQSELILVGRSISVVGKRINNEFGDSLTLVSAKALRIAIGDDIACTLGVN